MEILGFEPQTYGLQSRRSSQLSYTPARCVYIKMGKKRLARQYLSVNRFRQTEPRPCEALALAPIPRTETNFVCLPYIAGDLSRRKEVIQPHFPVRLPCYDFTLLTRRTFDVGPPCGLA